MALQLTKETLTGISGNYWEIINMIPDFYKEDIEIHIALFKDAAAKTAGKSYMDVKYHVFKNSDFLDFLGSVDIRTVAYNKIKVLPEWEGSIDV